MSKKKQSWKFAAGLTTVIMLSAGFDLMGVKVGIPAVHAVEQQPKSILSQEEAIRYAKKWLEIPDEYDLVMAQYMEPDDAPEITYPVWALTWGKDDVGFMFIRLDPVSGNLLKLRTVNYKGDSGKPGAKISGKEALEKAKQFLERVTTQEERNKMSQPHEPTFNEASGKYHISFERVENGIPFFENWMRMDVTPEGEVVSFTRQWYDGELQDASQVIAEKVAQELLENGAAPSLLYRKVSDEFALVYQYNLTDPQYVDAKSGTVINALGKPAEKTHLKPLGSTISERSREDRLIEKDEAQKIAEQFVKKLPGTYHAKAKKDAESWKFTFSPTGGSGKSGERVVFEIGDRGELVKYITYDLHGSGSDPIVEKDVSWEQAEASAIKLMNTLFNDRLGEIYLKESHYIQSDIIRPGVDYEFTFGWLKNGVPIEDATFQVMVKSTTGQAYYLAGQEAPVISDKAAGRIDIATALKVERENRSLMLTYFQPTGSTEPMLVYRYMELPKKQIP